MSDSWHLDRDVMLPFEPPGLTGKFGYPGRCWEFRRRDRLAWRLFSLVAHHDHASVVWRIFRDTRRAQSTSWNFGDGGACAIKRLTPRPTEDEEPVLPDLPLSEFSSIDEILTQEQREKLSADLAEIAKRRRLAEGDFA